MLSAIAGSSDVLKCPTVGLFCIFCICSHGYGPNVDTQHSDASAKMCQVHKCSSQLFDDNHKMELRNL